MRPEHVDGDSGAHCLPIVQYWHDGAPPDYIDELLDTFRQLNPEMPQLVFDEPTAEELIAEHFGEREVAAFRSCAVPAMQADYFRYCAALALGGVCCDADARCVAGLQATMPAPGEAWLLLRSHGAVINGLFAFGSPGHPLLELTVEVATANIERRWKSVYMATGPALWTTMYWVCRFGSFDAFIEDAPDPGWEEYARSCRETIGGIGRVSRSFEGVRIRPAAELSPFVRFPGTRFPYKETDAHWANVEGGTYRGPLPRAG